MKVWTQFPVVLLPEYENEEPRHWCEKWDDQEVATDFR